MTTTKRKTSAKSRINTAKAKETLNNTSNKGLEPFLSEFRTMLSAQTDALNQIARRISGGLGLNSKGKIARTIVENSPHNVVQTPRREKVNGEQIFIETLRQIGSPSTTKQVALELVKRNPDMKKLQRRDKSQFMQILYTAASQLAKENYVKRVPVAGRQYEYSLKDWSKKSKKEA